LLVPPVQRTWAPKGRTPVLRHTYRRDRLSVIGGLSVSPIRQRLGLYFQIYPWNLTSLEMVQYFAGLLRHLRGKVIVLLDRWAVHKDGKVVEFCRHHRRLHLEWFPAYAPEINPEEYVWTQTKRMLSNTCPENRDDLLDLVVNALCDVQQSQTLLAACLAQAAKHGLTWNL
jgi:transposase